MPRTRYRSNTRGPHPADFSHDGHTFWVIPYDYDDRCYKRLDSTVLYTHLIEIVHNGTADETDPGTYKSQFMHYGLTQPEDQTIEGLRCALLASFRRGHTLRIPEWITRLEQNLAAVKRVPVVHPSHPPSAADLRPIRATNAFSTASTSKSKVKGSNSHAPASVPVSLRATRAARRSESNPYSTEIKRADSEPVSRVPHYGWSRRSSGGIATTTTFTSTTLLAHHKTEPASKVPTLKSDSSESDSCTSSDSNECSTSSPASLSDPIDAETLLEPSYLPAATSPMQVSSRNESKRKLTGKTPAPATANHRESPRITYSTEI